MPNTAPKSDCESTREAALVFAPLALDGVAEDVPLALALLEELAPFAMLQITISFLYYHYLFYKLNLQCRRMLSISNLDTSTVHGFGVHLSPRIENCR
jgi:hypothetical protein